VYALVEEKNLASSLPTECFKCDGPVTADLKADEFGLYVASEDTKLYCLNATTGKNRCSISPAARCATLRDDAGSAYQYVYGKGLVCIDKLNRRIQPRDPMDR